MRPVSRRINFTGRKARVYFFCEADCRSNRSCSAARTKTRRRPGTENVAAIAGMAAAAEFVVQIVKSMSKIERDCAINLWRLISQNVPPTRSSMARSDCRLANTLNVSLLGFDSETLLMALDLEGVCASSGSACMVGSVVASHVLLAMGLPMERASSAVRFSLGKQTTAEEIDRAADAIDRIFTRLAKTKTKSSSAYAVA